MTTTLLESQRLSLLAHLPQSGALTFRIAESPEELEPGLSEIRSAFPTRFNPQPSSIALFFRPLKTPGERMRIVPEGNTVEIFYSRACEAFRALGIVMGEVGSRQAPSARTESTPFTSIGAMLDVSRNGVLRPEMVNKMIRHLALMGFNQLMLYTEDTYQVPGEPLFGYFRGAYTQKELSKIDLYASHFGIEVIPCIQTLGHLEQVLQWPPYSALKDTDGVMMAGLPATENLVGRMLQAACAPFRSRRIHVGMDEAHGIGAGRYRLQNGLKPPFEILTQHLQQVCAMCDKLGLEPMIWSDMFFRLGSKSNQYYDRASVIPKELAARIPVDVDLVYWDYYHTNSDFYDEWIARHRALGKQPIFAAGVWTWNRLWTALPHSLATVKAGMTSARANKLSEVIVTLWGDDGAECDLFSALPALQYFAEQAYSPDDADEALPVHFLGSCGASSEAWIAASDLDAVPGLGEPGKVNANPSKWILWHDPVLNFLDRHISSELPEHYRKVALKCLRAARRQPGDTRLHFVAQLAAVLSQKSALHLALRPAYRARNHELIERIADTELPALRRRVRKLWKMHRDLWHETYRPFGWEVLEGRYGALLARLESLDEKLAAWLKQPDLHIEELDCTSQVIWPASEHAELILTHGRASTASWQA